MIGRFLVVEVDTWVFDDINYNFNDNYIGYLRGQHQIGIVSITLRYKNHWQKLRSVSDLLNGTDINGLDFIFIAWKNPMRISTSDAISC